MLNSYDNLNIQKYFNININKMLYLVYLAPYKLNVDGKLTLYVPINANIIFSVQYSEANNNNQITIYLC